MNIAIYRVLSIVVAAYVCLAPHALRAEEIIGIAPPAIDVKVFVEGAREEHINVSRSITTGETRFRVENEGIDLVDIPDGTMIVLEEGVMSKDFFFTIDAARADVGTYEGVLSFTRLAQEHEPLAANGATIEFMLKATVRVSVIHRPDPSEAVSVHDFPSLIDDVGIEDLRIEQHPGTDGNRIAILWNFTNAGKNPLEGAVSRIRVTRKDDIFFDDQQVLAPRIPGEGAQAHMSDFVLPNSYPSGRYVVHVWVDDTEMTAIFWVVKPVLWWCLFALALSTLLAAGALIRSRALTHRR